MTATIKNRIKQFRVEAGHTQKELADLTGVSRQSIISIEQGRYTPSLLLALKFARVFNCSTDELFQLMEDH